MRKGQVWCTSLHYAVILIRISSVCSLTHLVIESVRPLWDWWMLCSCRNSSFSAVLNKGLSEVRSRAGNFFPNMWGDLSHLRMWWWWWWLMPLCPVLLYWSLQASAQLWVRWMRFSRRTREVIFHFAHVWKNRNGKYDTEEKQLNSNCWG